VAPPAATIQPPGQLRRLPAPTQSPGELRLPWDNRLVRIQLRYFASIRERLGKREETIDVPQGATVESVWRTLVTAHPQLAEQRYRPAVNQEYVDSATPLRDGDEVVFIPPVSGGLQGRNL
jgi:molybdopterin converting factor subunit 1